MSELELALDVKAKLGECPRWDERSKKLYWIDINAFQLHAFDPVSGSNKFLQFKEEIGCFSLRQGQGFVLAMRSGFFLLNSWDTDIHKICDPEDGLDNNRFNDGRCDARGRMIAGSYYPPKDHDGANLWCLEADGSTHKLADDLLTSNGTAFSPDNKTLYYSDTPKHCIYRCDYDLETGKVSNREIFHQFPKGFGRPDGASVDTEGCYWTALYEGSRVVRLNPHGEILQEIAVPVKCPTMVAFGGDDLKTLFITTVGDRPQEELKEYPHSGGIFKIRVDVAGLKENHFAG